MKTLLTSLIILIAFFSVNAQLGTEFWFAPPEVTEDHYPAGGQPIYLLLSTMNGPADISVSQPANPAFNGGSPILVSLPANTSQRVDLSAFIDDLETRPTNTILNTGLYINATDTVSAYYEYSNPHNCDIFALKGANSLGTEFYIPLHNNDNFYNHTFATHIAYASFDIVATEDNTEIIIYTRTDVDGHTAFTPFSITLNRGQTYSCAWTGSNYEDPATHPSGAVVVSDKPIAITIKDDSCHNPSGGCYDLMGDQIVPIDIIGNEYIAVEGQLYNSGEESIFITATENNTKVYIDGSGTPLTTLFAGQTYMYEIEGTVTTYVQTDKDVYLTHVTGFGCEEGTALLPPLNCAGSRQISFVRSTSEGFFLTVLVKAGAEDAFEIDGDPTLLEASDFNYVNGTGNVWMYARVQYNTTEIPVDEAKLITNSEDKFSLGLINGGDDTGCRYGYFSEYAAKIQVDANNDQTVCANNADVILEGSVTGGATQGIWATSGDGTFSPDASTLNATYSPGSFDIAFGSTILTLSSVSDCDVVQDDMTIFIDPAPVVDAGNDQDVCASSPTVTLNASLTNSVGAVWSGMDNNVVPDNNTLNGTYTPSAAEITAGTVRMYLTSLDILCLPVTDSIDILIDQLPTADAGPDGLICESETFTVSAATANNYSAVNWTSSGSPGTLTGAATLTPIYTPSAADIASGSVTLTLTVTGEDGCVAETAVSSMNIDIDPLPTADAGSDTNIASDESYTVNDASSTNSTVLWTSSGSPGTLTDETTLTPTYTPSAADITAGSVTLTLTATGTGACSSETAVSAMIITIDPLPTAYAGPDTTICETGTYTVVGASATNYSTLLWTSSGALGTLTNETTLSPTYTPVAADVTAGSVILTLTAWGTGAASSETAVSTMTVTIDPLPTADAGSDVTICESEAHTISGATATNYSSILWTSSGSAGTLTNETSLTPTYTPSMVDIIVGSVTLTLTATGSGKCGSETAVSTITVTIDPMPAASAGSNVTICENESHTVSGATVSNFSALLWTSSGSAGTLTDANTITPTYTPSAADIAAGSVTLTLTATGIGECNTEAAQSSITVTIHNLPTANAGPNASICANEIYTISGATSTNSTVLWTSSGSAGTLTNATTITPTYTPGAADIAAGSVTLTLTATGTGECNTETAISSMMITIDGMPAVDAGSDTSVCESSSVTINSAGASDYTSLQWTSSGSAGTLTNATNISPTYTPSAADITSGSVILTLTATGTGQCNTETSQSTITVTIDNLPSADAGPDMDICNNQNITITGATASDYSAILWTSSGTPGTLLNPTTLTPNYTPGAGDIADGSVILTLTAYGEGSCNTETAESTMLITIDTLPTADAGPDMSICENDMLTVSGATASDYSSLEWTSNGSPGTLINSATLTPTYIPGVDDIAAGSVILTLTVYGTGECITETTVSTMMVTINRLPLADAGPDTTICENEMLTIIDATASNYSSLQWTSSGAPGTITNATTINPSYTPAVTDIANGSVTLTLTATGIGDCNTETAVSALTVTIQEAPVADAGEDQVLCENNPDVHLNGIITNATGGIWSGGLGLYDPDNTTLDAVYSPTQNEINTGLTLTLTTTGNGQCDAANDAINITFTESPVVSAGADQTICANNPYVTLDGSVLVATGGIWTGGFGSYNPDNTTLDAVYSPSASEISAGYVQLYLTSTGNGNCLPVIDSMEITIDPAPVVNAGDDLSACENNPTVTLNGSVTGAGGGLWTGGLGVFNPNNSTLGATYTPTPGEIAGGSVVLTLTSTGNGNCIAESDQVTITFHAGPAVNAGEDQTICANNPAVYLNGSVTIASGGVWSGGLGIFTPDNTTLNAVYTPTAGEIASGIVTLTLTSTGNGDCNEETDNITIMFSPAPTVEAGEDVTVCANNSDVALSGIVTVATGGIWTTSGTGTFIPDNTNLNATYYPGSADITAGSVKLKLTSTGNGNCLAVSDSMTITITPAPVVNAGSDQTVCPDDLNILLNGSISGATTTGAWTTTGTGLFLPNNTTLNATYVASSQDSINQGVYLILTSTDNGDCDAVSDTMRVNIYPAGVADAGPDQTVCANNANVQLNGSVSGGAVDGVWATSGTGTFSPDNTELDAIYIPSANDIAAGTVTLTLEANSCNFAVDDMVVTITPAPVADAGDDQEVCINNPVVTLDGNITVAAGGIWSGGSGTFDPDNTTMNAEYSPSATEINNGYFELILTTTGNGDCFAVSDTMSVTVNPQPVVDAGDNVIVCANNAEVNIIGSVSGGSTTGEWTTSGNGTFTPDEFSLVGSYISSQDDINAGSVTLKLTSTNNGGCLPVSDSITVTYTPAPTVDAGTDVTLCSNNPNVSLSGTITVATGGYWTSTGTGMFLPDSTELDATYIPGAEDTLNGEAVLILTTTGNGNCLPESDSITITYTPAPYVYAGEDQIVCVDELDISLNGTVAGPTSTGIWSTGGTGTFTPDNTTLNATYSASSQDSLLGGVMLVLTSTNNGNCNAVSDTVIIDITPAGTAYAGIDQTVCANNAEVQLNGVISGGASEGIWTTSGTGAFVPNDTALNAVYFSSPQDTMTGSVTLTLTATNSCNDVSDDMTITYTDAPTADAGEDQTVCGNNANISLSGVVTLATGGEWSTSGTGSFVPNNTSLNAVYVPGTSDIEEGDVILSLTSTGNGGCNAVTDYLEITITPAPEVWAGPDQEVCETSTITQMMGIVSGGSTTGIWSSSGTGTFIPDNTMLNAYYEFGAADISAGSVQLTLTSTNNGDCNAETDMITITFGDQPFVYAGVDQVLCADNLIANLNGIVSGGSITGQWTTSGSGVFFPDNNTLNASYYFSTADSINGIVEIILISTNNGGCLPNKDTLYITVEPLPVVDAGTNQTICQTDSANLSGSVTNATGCVWSTSGTGIFLPDNTDMDPVYAPSSGDIAAGSIMVYLTSSGSVSCSGVTDSLVLTITPEGVVDAGVDLFVCANNAEVELSGIITGGASEGIWTTSGTGTFVPSDTSLAVTYISSSADTLSGSVILTLTATNSCGYAADSITLTYTPIPTANAGADQEVCANNADVSLSGSVTISTGGEWSSSSGAGTFIPNNTSLNAVYSPGVEDISNGSVYIYLSTTGNGNCNPVTDIMEVTFSPAPDVEAGPDQEVCITSTMTQLLGSVSEGATTGEWTTLGSGTFIPDNTTLDAYYEYSTADTTAGSVTLILTSTDNGDCLAETDAMTITFGDKPFVYAGEDMTVCADDLNVQLDGAVSGGSTTGEWTTSGTGTFVPDNQTIDAVYIFSVVDSILGSVELILTSTDNGGCLPNSDTTLLSVEQVPIVNAGPDQYICSDEDTVVLAGSYLNAAGIQWTTSGSGEFYPNDTVISAVYLPDDEDFMQESLTIVLSSTQEIACDPAADTMIIEVTQMAVVDAGQDQTVCANNADISLNGQVTGGAGGGVWTTTGGGIFTPDDSLLNAVYIPDTSDIQNGSVVLILHAVDACNEAYDSIEIFFTPAPVVNAGNDRVVCGNNATISLFGNVQVAGGGIWSTSGTGVFTPDPTSLNAVYTPDAADIDSGLVYLYLTSTDNGDCNPVTDSISLTITPAPVVDAGVDQTVCISATSTQMLGSVTGGSSTGEWSTSGTGMFLPDSTNLMTNYVFSADDTSAGSVTIILTSTDNGDCFPEKDTMVITFGDTPFVDAGEDQTVCADDSVTLDGFVTGGSTTGVWSTSGTGIFYPDDVSPDATYHFSSTDSLYGSVDLILTSTNNGECLPGTDTMHVTIQPVPVVDAGEDQYICSSSDTIYLSGSVENADGGVWTTDGTGTFLPDDTTPDAVYLMSSADSIAGEVNLILTSTGTEVCDPDMDTVNISVVIPLIVDFTYIGACVGQDVNFSDNTTVLYGDITGWKWNFGGGNISYAQNTSFSYDVPGNYDVTLTVYSSLGCEDSITQSVTVAPLPTADFSFTTVCYLDSVDFTDLSSISSGSVTGWQWIFGDGDTSYMQNPVHLYAGEGTYSVILTVTSDAGCTSSVTQQIMVYSPPDAGFDYSFDCANTTVVFTNTSTSGGVDIIGWYWNFGDGDTSMTEDPVHEYDTAGTYTVRMIVYSSAYCTDTAIEEITIYTINGDFITGNACVNDYIQFTDNSGDGIISWSWDFGDGNVSSLQNPVHSYSSEGTYNVTMIIASDEGCVDTVIKQAEAYPVATAGFSVSADLYQTGSLISFIDASDGAEYWEWDFGDSSAVSTVQNPVHTYNIAGIFTVIQVVNNQYGCSDTSTTQISISDDGILPPKAPTGFTPNGDGVNDVFYIKGGPFNTIDFKVYNKWGELIFETTDPDTGWDGMRDGKEQPVGVYVYTVEAETVDGKEYKKSGDVTLIR